MQDSQTRNDDFFERAYRTRREEIDVAVTADIGTIPSDFTGTFMWNGPGICEAGSDPLAFFDAYGMVCKLTFENGNARFRNAHVRSSIFEREQSAGKQLARRAFTNMPGRLKNLFNIKLPSLGMHDCFRWNGKIYATDDRGYWALDEKTLATIGPDFFGGNAQKGEIMGPVPRHDVEKDTLIAYKIRPGIRTPDVITFFEFDRSWKVLHKVETALSKSGAFVHDVAFTPNYYVVFEAPMRINARKALLGKGSIFSAFEWPATARPIVTLVPRTPGRAPIALEVPPPHQMIFHIANAYEDGDRLVVDAGGTNAPLDFSASIPRSVLARQGMSLSKTPESAFVRYTIDTRSNRVTGELLGSEGIDEPEVNHGLHGRLYRFAYGMGTTPQNVTEDPRMFPYVDAIVKVDTQAKTTNVWSPGPRHSIGQASFAPRGGAWSSDPAREEDGYVLCTALDVDRGQASVIIQDAKRFGEVLARVPLGGYFGVPSHSRFEI